MLFQVFLFLVGLFFGTQMFLPIWSKKVHNSIIHKISGSKGLSLWNILALVGGWTFLMINLVVTILLIWIFDTWSPIFVVIGNLIGIVIFNIWNSRD